MMVDGSSSDVMRAKRARVKAHVHASTQVQQETEIQEHMGRKRIAKGKHAGRRQAGKQAGKQTVKQMHNLSVMLMHKATHITCHFGVGQVGRTSRLECTWRKGRL